MSSTSGQLGAKAAVLALSLATAGCATVTRSVPQDIAATGTAYPVRAAGRMYQLFTDGYFEVGNYHVSGIHHDISVGNELSIGQYSQASSTGRFTFAIAGPRTKWAARCNRQFQSRTVSLRQADVEDSKSTLRCEFGSGTQQASVELHDKGSGLYGTVMVGDISYALRQYADLDSSTRGIYVPEALGLRIDRGGQNNAALAFDYPGTFWLNGSLPPEQQDAFAAVLAALLINARH